MFSPTVLVVLSCVAIFGASGASIHVDDDVCTECEQIVGTIHLVLSNNETEASVLAALEQICGQLPSEFQSICTELVSTYGKELIDAAVKYLADPSQLCALLGLCNGTMSQMEAFENLKRISTISFSHVDMDIVPDNLKGISNCALCEFVMSIIQSALEDKPMQEFFQDELTKICESLPHSESQQCLELVQALEPEFYMEFVKKYFNPVEFCPNVGICPPN